MNVSVQNSRVPLRLLELLVGCALVCEARAGTPMSADQAVALAMKQNPEIAIARKQLEAARGGVVEARSGYLPSVVASGLYRKRERQESSRLRTDDYNASARVVIHALPGSICEARWAMPPRGAPAAVVPHSTSKPGGSARLLRGASQRRRSRRSWSGPGASS